MKTYENPEFAKAFWLNELRKLGANVEEIAKSDPTPEQLKGLFIGINTLRMKQIKKVYLLKVDAGRDEEGNLIFKPVRAFISEKRANLIAESEYEKPSLTEVEEMELE